MTRARDLAALGNNQITTYGSNVGIGTTIATSSLTVSGDTYITGVVTASSYYGDGSKLTGIGANSAVAYAAIAGFSTVSIQAGVSTISSVAGFATVATRAGVSSFSTLSGSAGFSTVATQAGVSTTVSGGIADVTALQVSGISTFTNNVIVSSGLVGIGSTIPTNKFSVIGNASIVGVLTVGSLLGGFNPGQIDVIQSGGGSTRLSPGSIQFNGNGNIQQISDQQYFRAGQNGASSYLFSNYYGGFDHELFFIDKDGNTRTSGNVIISGITTTQRLNVGTGGTVITTTSAGLVGINSTNPTSTLTVGGATSTASLYVTGVGTFNTSLQLGINGSSSGSLTINSSFGSNTNTAISPGAITFNNSGASNIALNGTQLTFRAGSNGASSYLFSNYYGGFDHYLFSIDDYGNTTTYGSANISGITTSTGGFVGNLTGNASSATYATSTGIATYASSAGVSTNVKGTGSRVLYNSSTDTTTTSSNLTFDGTTLAVNSTPGSNVSSVYLTGTPFGSNTKNGLLGIGQLGFNDSNIIANFTANVNSYSQVIIQNLSTGNAASSDFIVNSDSPLGQTYYGDFGINGTGYAGGGPFGDASGTYLYSAGGTLSIGTNDAYDFRIATGSAFQTPVTRVTVAAVTGNVGINSTSPSSVLSVVGNATITGVVTATKFVGDGSSLTGIVGAGSSAQFSRTVTTFTATSNQTTFSVAYTVGYVDVYLNGARLSSSEFTASDGSTVVLVTGASLNDVIDIISYGGTGTALWNVGTGSSIYSLSSVGIGTTNPTNALTVGGGTSTTNLYVSGISTFAGITTVTGSTLFAKQINVSGATTISGNLNAPGNYYVKLARLTNQTIPSGTDTLIGFTATSDTNGWYSGITTRTTPTVAGNYYVSVMLNWQAGATTNVNQSNIQVRKNGNTFAISIVGIQTFQYSQFVCGIVTMNGTTDYIDFTAYTSNATSQGVNGEASGLYTKMEIFKLN